MSLCRILPRVLLCALGVTSFASARADKFTFSGNFSADNSVYEVSIDTLTKQAFTLKTTSFGKGGFVPALTLFDATSGQVMGYDEPGNADATLKATLTAGTYDLFLTEFPNVANGNLGDGFLFANDPTATGDSCGVSGGMFLDTTSAPCTQLGSNFALTVNSPNAATVMPVASTPEPSSLLLMLAPTAGLLWTRRRKNA